MHVEDIPWWFGGLCTRAWCSAFELRSRVLPHMTGTMTWQDIAQQTDDQEAMREAAEIIRPRSGRRFPPSRPIRRALSADMERMLAAGIPSCIVRENARTMSEAAPVTRRCACVQPYRNLSAPISISSLIFGRRCRPEHRQPGCAWSLRQSCDFCATLRQTFASILRPIANRHKESFNASAH